jgi:hypothetical protein
MSNRMGSSVEGRLGIPLACGLETSLVRRMNMSLATTERVRGGHFSDTAFVVVDTVGLVPVVHSAKSVESLSTLGCPGRSTSEQLPGYGPIHPREIPPQTHLDKMQHICGCCRRGLTVKELADTAV